MSDERLVKKLSKLLTERADRVAGGALTLHEPLEFILRGESVSARVYERYNGTLVLALDVYVDDVDEDPEVFRWVATRSGVMPFATIRVDRPLVRGTAPSAVKISHALVAEDVNGRQLDEVLDGMTYMSRRARRRLEEIAEASELADDEIDDIDDEDDDGDGGEPVVGRSATATATAPPEAPSVVRPSDDPNEVIDGADEFGPPPGPVVTKSVRPIDAVLAELSDLVGLEPVKEQIGRLVAAQRADIERRRRGLAGSDQSPHLVFVGNPGTGKTTVARLVGEVYRALGLLESGHVVEADRSTLVAAYLGQTAIKTRRVCESALGGVLFIDEAYSLVNDRDMYGEECINTLLSFMENNRGKFAVVVAGYPEEMYRFINSNPGLHARFDMVIGFPDYATDELEEIFLGIARKADYELTPEALVKVRRFIASWPRTRGFGNGREVRKLFGDIARRHAELLFAGDEKRKISTETLKTIGPDAVPEPPIFRDRKAKAGDGGYL